MKNPNKRLLASLIPTLAATVLGAPAYAQTKAPSAERVIDEVVVTARRKEESAQQTPVAVTALDTEGLYRQNITEMKDLMTVTPGINFTSSGGANNTVFSIRGRSRGVFGNAQPAVASYVNEVPLSAQGASIPNYDMASIQVLKGPQGTLFGRNSTAGAVLVTTARPEHHFGGFITGKLGNYDARLVEGAINIPLVEDKVALRVAGQLDKRDGYTKDMMHPDKGDLDEHDRDSHRISLLVEPTANFSNLTVYEKNNYDERGLGIIPVGYQPGTGTISEIPYYSGGAFDPTGVDGVPSGFIIDPSSPLGIAPCGGDPSCDIGVVMARQDAAGIRKVWLNQLNTAKTELTSWSNTTIWDLGAITLKNIIGYREVYSAPVSDIDGLPFPMIDSFNPVSSKQWTEEFQVSGSALGGALEYIGGLFWLKSEPDGDNQLLMQLFAQSGTPYHSTAPAPFNGGFGPSDFFTDESKAVFGQISYDLTHLNASLEGLSVDIGLRHTKDRAENCPVAGVSATAPMPRESDCERRIREDFSKTTYNLGLNYQLNDEILIYGVTRTGYRAGGVNSPILGGSLTSFQSYSPETVQDFELGLKSDWSLGDIFGRLNVALYHSKYKDVHYAVPTTGVGLTTGGIDGDYDDSNDPTGGLFYSNAGEATVEGIEVELITQLTDNLKLTFSGSKMDKDLDPKIRVPEGFPLELIEQRELEAFVFLGAPDWSYTANIDYTLPLDAGIGEIILSSRYFRISDIHYGGNIYADAYEIVDFRADWYGVLGSSIDAAVYLMNAFDEEALLGPSSSTAGLGVNSGFYNAPRMWGVSLRYSF